MTNYSDNDYLKGILEHNSRVIKRIYAECFPLVRKMVIEYGGDTDKAKDVFQDTLLLIYHKTLAGNMKLFCRFSTYFYGVSKKMWLQELKYRKRYINGNGKSLDIAEEPDCVNEYGNTFKRTFAKHFKELSADCRKILRMHFNKATIEEIQSIMGYNNRHHAIDRKYRCKRSLINRILNDPNFKTIRHEYTKKD